MWEVPLVRDTHTVFQEARKGSIIIDVVIRISAIYMYTAVQCGRDMTGYLGKQMYMIKGPKIVKHE